MPGSKYVPKHRALPTPRRTSHPGPARSPLRTSARKVVVFSGVAVAATGVAVTSGVLTGQGSTAAGTKDVPASVAEMSSADIAAREERVSRSGADRTTQPDARKSAELSNATGAARTGTVDLTDADPRTLTKALMPRFGMSVGDFSCVDEIWTQESGWNVHADNPTSSAYGIPQALPGSKMSSAGPNWESSAETQIKWGLGYIKSRYGTPCSAWSYKSSHGWY